MAAEPRVATYHFGPLQKSSAVAGMSWFQVGAIGACGTLAIGIMRSSASPVAMAVAVGLLVLGFAVGFVRVGGRLVEDWVFPVRYWTSRRGRRARFWARPEGPEAPEGAPPGFEHLRFFAVRLASGEVGVVFDQAQGAYLGVLASRGGAFPLVDRVEQDRLLRVWGDVLDGWCVDGETVFRLQLLERTLPEDGDALTNYVERAASVPEGSRALTSYRRLLADAQPLTQRHESFVVVAVSQSSPSVRRGGGDHRAACEALALELNSLRRRARAAEIAVEGVLGPHELVRCLRVGFDPQVAVRPERWRPEPAPRLADAWPAEAATTWSHYQADGVHHVSFWVAEWPRIPVGADFLGPLFLHSQGTRTVSMVMEPVAPARAQQEVLDARTNFLADQRQRDKAGYVPTAFRDAQGQALDRREAELAAGHGEYRHSAYVTVSAPDPEALETAATEIVRLASRCKLQLLRLYGQQDLGFACALPLARGLR